ncbi:DUF7856 family protein [Halarchaeum nitratireducens]|nr:hypothetical protein [Halarchaeum nitratireducens]
MRSDALDFRDADVSAADVVRAIRDADGWLDCPTPTAVHDTVGLLDRPRTVGPAMLAAAARSRGHDAPVTARLRTLRGALADPIAEVRGLRAARERLATLGADVVARRERVERLGGQVAALRNAGMVDADVMDAHGTAIAALTDAETEVIAATETYERLRREARIVRDERERRLRLADEERRLKRERDAALVAEIRSSYERARRAVPGGSWRDALALARVSRVRAPLVLAGGPFERATRAAACLDAPVVLVAARV